MLTDLLLENRWFSPTILVLIILLGPLIGSRLVSRARLAWWLTAASLVPIAVLTLLPQNRRLFARCTFQWDVPTPDKPELFGNVVLFVAPVLLAAVATRRPLLALLAGAGLSVTIEALQAAVPAIGRSCDSADWLTNTIGAIIGAALGWAALRLARQTSPPIPA